jgi:hypothetical protein
VLTDFGINKPDNMKEAIYLGDRAGARYPEIVKLSHVGQAF